MLVRYAFTEYTERSVIHSGITYNSVASSEYKNDEVARAAQSSPGNVTVGRPAQSASTELE